MNYLYVIIRFIKVLIFNLSLFNGPNFQFIGLVGTATSTGVTAVTVAAPAAVADAVVVNFILYKTLF